MLELLVQKTCEKQNINWSQCINEVEECQFLEIHAPSGIDLSENTEYASQAAIWGIEVGKIIYLIHILSIDSVQIHKIMRC